MTGSAEKCFSMNGGERCIMAIIIFRKGRGFGGGVVKSWAGPEGWRMTGSAEKCFSMNVVERCIEKG